LIINLRSKSQAVGHCPNHPAHLPDFLKEEPPSAQKKVYDWCGLGIKNQKSLIINLRSKSQALGHSPNYPAHLPDLLKEVLSPQGSGLRINVGLNLKSKIVDRQS
jgi:hypothetical protein